MLLIVFLTKKHVKVKTRDHKLADGALLKVSNVCYWYDYFVNIVSTLFGSK